MKLVTFKHPGGTSVGAVVGSQVVDLSDIAEKAELSDTPDGQLTDWRAHVPPRSMLRLLGCGSDTLTSIGDILKGGLKDRALFDLERVELLAPIPRPGKIVGVGKNYAEHRAETGGGVVDTPTIFFKASTTVVGPGAAVVHPPAIEKMDFEGELAVVIGQFASQVSREDALQFVAGYTILNDITAREFQHDRTPRQTSLAKSIDGFCPIGPWIVTKDDLPDPQGLDLAFYLNGEQMQHAVTSDMIFPVDFLIEYITRYVSLEPGDIIATGTPAGIGAFRKPPVWLKPGDKVEITISQIGSLKHTVV
jgi:2-keto-4-pentenoate hydratase/2-oxohepta-3-ene-1,7-dioic acid hydratase in catechol pathway